MIEDLRFNPPENLLTEVRVPLKEIGDGFWADAKEVCDDLQMGPSRIDGVSLIAYATVDTHVVVLEQVLLEFTPCAENTNRYSSA